MTTYLIQSQVSFNHWQTVAIAHTKDEADTALKAMQRIAGSALRIIEDKPTHEQQLAARLADDLKTHFLWSRLAQFAVSRKICDTATEASDALVLVHEILEKFSASRG